MSHSVRTISAVLVAIAAGGCTSEAPLVEVKGACADVFKAQLCTWAKTKGTKLVEAGAVVPLASIENAPANPPMVWPPAAAAVIDMPEPVRQQGGLTQLTMFWEAGGHPPGAYMTPHFDFHFYTVAASERAAMDCKDLSVPQMGMHALLASEIERKDAMSGSMVIGYYKGKPIFIEPMLSKAMLMRKQSFDLAIPDVPGLSGAHPTKFHAEYDAKQQAYRFTYSAFTPAT